MQFSIQRPTLPSAETHPEEKLYRRLDVTTWLRHLNHSGQVEEEYKLRKVCDCDCVCMFINPSTHTSLCAVVLNWPLESTVRVILKVLSQCEAFILNQTVNNQSVSVANVPSESFQSSHFDSAEGFKSP